MALKAVLEFVDEAGTWTLDVTGEVDEHDVEHVYVTVEERKPNRKRPITTRADLDVRNALAVADAIREVAESVERRLADA